MHIARIALAMVSTTLFLSGCAATQSAIDLSVPEPRHVAGKVFAKIVDVKDMRRFEADSSDPSVPLAEQG